MHLRRPFFDSQEYFILTFWLVTFCGWGTDTHGCYKPT